MSDGLNREGFTETAAAAATPGQAACIAWNAHYAEQHGIEARNEWAASDPRGRAAWEAGAEAAAADIAAERDKYRDALECIAGYAAGTATKQMIGNTARRALDAVATGSARSTS